MAYDEDLADRIRELVATERGLTEQRMFGGLAFLINGHMSVTASGRGGLMLRVDPARTDELIARPGVRRMVMRGREMDGWLRVDADVLATDDQLRQWVTQGVGYARSLPPK
ncbi:MAG TPA: TfoX/Sxy family protein [Jatrophihabitantaceae bacterium]|jgi:TfoX/Sxy family transcriptional regulator of competence genes